MVKNPPVNEGDVRDLGLIPELERFPGGVHRSSLQYSCLGNPMDRGAWWVRGPWGHKELDMTEAINKYMYVCVCVPMYFSFPS